MLHVVLYTTDCPKGKVLENTLIKKGIEYSRCDNIATMQKMDMNCVPRIQVIPDGPSLDFIESINWANNGASVEAYDKIIENRPATSEKILRETHPMLFTWASILAIPLIFSLFLMLFS